VKIFLLFAAMIGCTVMANLLMKTGALHAEAAGGPWWHQFLQWRIIAGLASFGAAALIYTFILRLLPLNVAQAFASAQFIAVILASWIVLSEPIGTAQWTGIALIACGIGVVGWSRG
jgi:drug/metabolite transporter (DMT)-like permease